MWCSKAKYNALLQECNEIRAHSNYIEAQFNALTEKKASWCNDLLIMHRDTWRELTLPQRELGRAFEAAQAELNAWKQKYADEVQKRLTLIEQMKV